MEFVGTGKRKSILMWLLKIRNLVSFEAHMVMVSNYCGIVVVVVLFLVSDFFF